MSLRNPVFHQKPPRYLFSEITKRIEQYQEKHPEKNLINLGIGDTVYPLQDKIVEGLHKKVKALGTEEGYRGYGPPLGDPLLRHLIAEKLYKIPLDKETVFISDGAKCDVGRMQMLFSQETIIAIEDPSYPAYLAAHRLFGKEMTNVVFLPCTKENNYFPDLERAKKFDLLYLCSPNNPTGRAYTKEELKSIVTYAQKNNVIIIYDVAYAAFIQDETIPRSIYEIEGSETVAIEVGSFSKWAGFTGIRLGYSVVPKELRFKDGGSVRDDWIQIQQTFFNGASQLAEAGGIAALQNESASLYEECHRYLSAARILKHKVEEAGFQVASLGEHCPYLWVYDLKKSSSWELFDYFLTKYQLITTPGVGFGPSGEGYLRLSGFVKEDLAFQIMQR